MTQTASNAARTAARLSAFVLAATLLAAPSNPGAAQATPESLVVEGRGSANYRLAARWSADITQLQVESESYGR